MAKEGGVNKVEWRARLRATRARVAETARAPAAAAVAAHLTASPLWAATTVLAYAASATELSTLPLLHATLSAGKRLVLPRVGAGGDLTLHQIDALEGLVVGYRGLLEPAATAPRVAPAEVELAIIPLAKADTTTVSSPSSPPPAASAAPASPAKWWPACPARRTTGRSPTCSRKRGSPAFVNPPRSRCAANRLNGLCFPVRRSKSASRGARWAAPTDGMSAPHRAS